MAQDVLERILEVAPQTKSGTLFDVGANVGQSLEGFLKFAPGANIFSFEPVKASFEQLMAGFGDRRNVRLENLALSSRGGCATMKVDGTSTGNIIVSSVAKGKPTETVKVIAGDEYCAQAGIRAINFLKVDTEGHDLDVLVGFRNMLAQSRVDFIEVEVGLNPDNKRHVDLQRFRGFLEPLGYYMFDIGDVVYETFISTSRPYYLRRANVTFIRRTVAEEASARATSHQTRPQQGAINPTRSYSPG